MKDWVQLATSQIIQELKSRRGLRQEIDQMDDSIKEEIFERIEEIIRKAKEE